jgi:hypothetical protein
MYELWAEQHLLAANAGLFDLGLTVTALALILSRGEKPRTIWEKKTTLSFYSHA